MFLYLHKNTYVLWLLFIALNIVFSPDSDLLFLSFVVVVVLRFACFKLFVWIQSDVNKPLLNMETHVSLSFIKLLLNHY